MNKLPISDPYKSAGVRDLSDYWVVFVGSLCCGTGSILVREEPKIKGYKNE